MKPDDYYGAVAENYDASRSVKPKWAQEITAVDAFLDEGPVLDVPFGTGRFVPVYRGKGLAYRGIDISADMLKQAAARHGRVNASLGSIYDLKFRPGVFGTVVCVRFMEWLPLVQSLAVLKSLSRLAPNLIVSINHGVEGKPEAYTYDLGKFLSGIDGLFIERRHVTANVNGIVSELFKLRPARWPDVLEQFSHGDEVPGAAVQRIADKHAAFLGFAPSPVNQETARVRAEYWSGERLGRIVVALAEHRFVTDKWPARMGGPLTVLKRDGAEFILDGRRRANVLMKEHGPHPVLVVEC